MTTPRFFRARLAAAGVVLVLGLSDPAQGFTQPPPGDRPGEDTLPIPGIASLEARGLRGAEPRADQASQADGRPCPGCPKRRVSRAVLHVPAINLIYQGINLALPPGGDRRQFMTGPESWWKNISRGFEWDDNTFEVNQFGHPYQGANYFTAGRANGLSFWESAPLALLGSLGWEVLHERHPPSWNDLVMTSVGGVTLGEMLHRAAWLIRDPMASGKGRLAREIAAAAVDPITGINRFLSGDAGRTVEKPPHYVPSALHAAFDAGVLWRGDNLSFVEASGQPFLQARLAYGTLTRGRAEQPFDAFLVDVRLGGGSGISEVRVRGRLTGRPLAGSTGDTPRHTLHVAALLGYDYANNSAYQFGGQTVSAALTGESRFSSDWRLVATASGGVLLLGAIDSLYEAPPDRFYDFGSGFNYGGSAALSRKGHPLLRAAYDAVWLHAIDGERARHWTRSASVDLVVPVRRRVGIGAAAELVRRRSSYDGFGDVRQRFPQLRAYLSWMY